LAVVRLTDSSNCVDACAGRSAGLLALQDAVNRPRADCACFLYLSRILRGPSAYFLPEASPPFDAQPAAPLARDVRIVDWGYAVGLSDEGARAARAKRAGPASRSSWSQREDVVALTVVAYDYRQITGDFGLWSETRPLRRQRRCHRARFQLHHRHRQDAGHTQSSLLSRVRRP